MASAAELVSFHYQAGSCTLEVSGEVSPLSQVAGKPVLKRSRFHLQLRSSQAILLDVRGSSRGDSSPRSPLFVLQQAVDTYLQQYLAGPPPAAIATAGESPGIRIQSLSLTRHRMYLANWGIATAPSVVDLSSLQLNDLAQVLSQLDTATEILPVAPPRRQRRVMPWRWAGTAASVLIVVGSLGVIWPYLNPSSVPTVSENAEDFAESQNQAQTGESQPIESLESSELQDEAEIAPPSAANQPPTIETAPEAASRYSQGSSPTPTAPTTGPSPTPQATPAPDMAPAKRPAPAAEPGAAGDDADSSQAALSAPESASRQAPPTASVEDTPAVAGDAPANTALSAPSPEAARSQPEAGRPYEAAPEDAVQTWLSALATALESGWEPPAGLNQPLQYRLAIASDGTIQTLEPRNPAARRYPNPVNLSALSLPLPPAALPGSVATTFYPDGSVTVTTPEP
ncbi:hypothetical protein C7271_11265 [filamentous cyanobacterium CCP5]|nr:hypothetical protein C7271_11265 [filamentous cyanobacterium CCP5]